MVCFLGHNTDGKYFVTSNKMSFRCETRPRKVNVFIEKARDGHIVPVTDVEVRELACGANHTVGPLCTFIYSSPLRSVLWNCLSVCEFERNLIFIEGLPVDIEFDFDKKKYVYNTNVWQVIFTALNFYEFIGKLTILNLIC